MESLGRCAALRASARSTCSAAARRQRRGAAAAPLRALEQQGGRFDPGKPWRFYRQKCGCGMENMDK